MLHYTVVHISESRFLLLVIAYFLKYFYLLRRIAAGSLSQAASSRPQPLLLDKEPSSPAEAEPLLTLRHLDLESAAKRLLLMDWSLDAWALPQSELKSLLASHSPSQAIPPLRHHAWPHIRTACCYSSNTFSVWHLAARCASAGRALLSQQLRAPILLLYD